MFLQRNYFCDKMLSQWKPTIDMNPMIKKLSILCVMMLASAFAFADDAAKVGWVNVDRILKDSTPAKNALNKIETDFGKRTKDLTEQATKLKALNEKFDRDAAVMSESERNRRQRELGDLDKDFQRRQREFKEDLNQRQFEERSVILERAEKVIKQIAEAEKYDIILQEPPVFVSSKVDITEKVIKTLNSAGGSSK
jgi:outer membrane protein